MAIKVITTFVDSATVRIVTYVRDVNDALAEPTAVEISIWEPGETDPTVDGTDIVVTGRLEDGIYEYYYHKGVASDAMESGEWRGEILIKDGTGVDAIISPARFSFTVRED